MASENDIQQFVHNLEEGSWVGWIKFVAFLVFTLAVASAYFFWDFVGLSNPRAMEQAQIARSVASGQGFATNELRPAALAQIQHKRGDFPDGTVPDTYHAPLHSLVLAPFLLLTKKDWKMTMNDLIYVNDRMIVVVDMACFILSVGVIFLLLRRLFDVRLATMGCMMLVLCDRLWQFSTSGLPQMLMLLLFSIAVYLLARAIEAQELGERPLAWLVACAVAFGLLGLTHAMTFFIFGACVLFVALYFRPWWLAPILMVAIVGGMYLPWMIRNYHVCGYPLGIAYLSILDGIRGSEDSIMRGFTGDYTGIQPYFFRYKLMYGLITQMGSIYTLLGAIVAAPFFLAALLYRFRRRETDIFKWAVLVMWIGAVFGMCLYNMNMKDVSSIPSQAIDANDLHVLFIPLFVAFGLALLLVLWSRLEVNLNYARLCFLALLFIVSAMPIVGRAFGSPKNKVAWPPYVPPYITLLRDWSNSDDIIVSDMPWAVGWYANRKCLWLPSKMTDVITLHDYDQLHAPIIGIYLTPITGDLPLFKGILRGEYSDWAPLILRSNNFRDFPFNAVAPMPIDNECVFYADHDRWTRTSD